MSSNSCTDLVSCPKNDDEENETEREEGSTAPVLPEESIGQVENDENYCSKLDSLGPIVLNVDGTMSRIQNWSAMTDAEKESAFRLIAARNKKRKEALLQSKS
jgi:hypothetical protein